MPICSTIMHTLAVGDQVFAYVGCPDWDNRHRSEGIFSSAFRLLLGVVGKCITPIAQEVLPLHCRIL
jgi:hypothetical protein